MNVHALFGPLMAPGVLVDAAVSISCLSPLVKQFDTDLTFSTLVAKPVLKVTLILVDHCPLTNVTLAGTVQV